MGSWSILLRRAVRYRRRIVVATGVLAAICLGLAVLQSDAEQRLMERCADRLMMRPAPGTEDLPEPIQSDIRTSRLACQSALESKMLDDRGRIDPAFWRRSRATLAGTRPGPGRRVEKACSGVRGPNGCIDAVPAASGAR